MLDLVERGNRLEPALTGCRSFDLDSGVMHAGGLGQASIATIGKNIGDGGQGGQGAVSAGERTDRTGVPFWPRVIASLKPWKRSHSGSREPAGLAQAWWCLVCIAFANLGPVGVVALAPFGHFPSEQPTLAAVVAVNVAALAVEAWLVAPAWIRLYRAREHPGPM